MKLNDLNHINSLKCNMRVRIKNYCCILILTCVLASYYLYSLWIPSEINCISRTNKSYTYIIVGAGTAGCVLAARLTDNANNRVLLIEAGGHFNILSKIPFVAVFLQKSRHDWRYETEPQKWSSLGFNNRIQSLPRGKGLGGSNQLNLLIYNRFIEETDWELQDSLLKYLHSKKCSKQSRYIDHVFLFGDSRKCAIKCIERFLFRIQRSKLRLANVLKQSLKELRQSEFKFFDGDAVIYKGERWSTYRSHLLPASNRENLHILCHSEVNKILFKGKRAVGVELNNRKIYSESEIIISAGSINTPKLLLTSGIGNKQYLKRINVPTVQNLPGVGENLHDHIAFPIYVEIQEPLSLTLNKVINIKEVFRYVTKKEGIFGSSPVAAFLQSPKNFLILFAGATPEDPFRQVANYKPETFRTLFPFSNDYLREGFVFLAGCKDTKSRGFIKLTSEKSIIVDPQYLQKNEDVECIKNVTKLAFELLNTTAFKEIGANAHFPKFPKCSGNLTEDAYIECIIRVAALTTYHQAGTCKMGNDSASVVDSHFRVKGLVGLRIVDGSVLSIPSNNFPNTAITVMAEYASSLLAR